MFSTKRKDDMYTKMKRRKMKADFPFGKCRRWRGGIFFSAQKGRVGCFPHKEKDDMYTKLKSRKMKADFPRVQDWISHFYMSALWVANFLMVSAVISRIFRFDPIYLDFPYES